MLDICDDEDITFRAYPLTDDKDFSNLFHPERDNILKLVGAVMISKKICVSIPLYDVSIVRMFIYIIYSAYI